MASLSNILIYGLTTNTGNGVWTQNGDTFMFSNVNVTCHFNSFALQPAASGFVYNVFAVNCFGDGVGMSAGGNGWLINGSASGATLRRIKLTNCWAGIVVDSGFKTISVEDVEFNNCIAITNQKHGYEITSGSNYIQLTGCTARGNSFNNSNTYSGLFIDTGIGNFSVIGGKFGGGGSIGTQQKYGIEINGTSHDNYTILGPDVNGNTTGGLLDPGLGPTKHVAFVRGGGGATVQTYGDLTLRSESGAIQAQSADGTVSVEMGSVSSATVKLLLKGAPSGGNAVVQATGSTDANLALYPRGNGYGVLFDPQRANWLAATGAASGAAPYFFGQSFVDADVDVSMIPQGSGGRVKYGAYSAGALSIVGSIEIKDASGNARKLAVVS